MEITLSLKRHRHVARIGTFLTVLALISGMVGCGGNGGESYTLTIASTTGGAVATPGEGTFTYDASTVVSLNATSDSGYQFAEWTGDLDTVANVTAAATTITMNGDYSITADFYSPEIWTWYDLDAIRNSLSGGYLLMNSLNSTTPGYDVLAGRTANGGKGWQPIGTEGDHFSGRLDGQGYEIRDLFISRPEEDYIGLFYYVDYGGHIDNIGVVGMDVTGRVGVGGLVCSNSGNVSNSYSTGSVTGYGFVGGLMAWNWFGTVTNSYSTCNVTGPEFVGGLVGSNFEGTVNNCYSTGNVTGSYDVGGLVGSISEGTVSDSYSSGSVTGHEHVGGLTGFNSGTVANCHSTASVTGDDSVGGLVGENYDTVSNSFWDTQTSGLNFSAGGTGKNTTQMQDIITFSGAGWDITTVGGLGERNTTYIWNIVHNVTYPFLSWEP